MIIIGASPAVSMGVGASARFGAQSRWASVPNGPSPTEPSPDRHSVVLQSGLPASHGAAAPEVRRLALGRRPFTRIHPSRPARSRRRADAPCVPPRPPPDPAVRPGPGAWTASCSSTARSSRPSADSDEHCVLQLHRLRAQRASAVPSWRCLGPGSRLAGWPSSASCGREDFDQAAGVRRLRSLPSLGRSKVSTSKPAGSRRRSALQPARLHDRQPGHRLSAGLSVSDLHPSRRRAGNG